MTNQQDARALACFKANRAAPHAHRGGVRPQPRRTPVSLHLQARRSRRATQDLTPVMLSDGVSSLSSVVWIRVPSSDSSRPTLAALALQGEGRMPVAETCKVEGCSRVLDKHSRRGYCNLHYCRLKRHGDPLTNLNPPPRPKPQPITYIKTCDRCGETFSTQRSSQLRCSTCPTYVPCGPYPEKPCEDCGSPLATQTQGRPRKVCPGCHEKRKRLAKRLADKRSGRKTDMNRRRRARKRGALVAPVSAKRIYERDSWRCQICGDPIKRDAKAPHPLSPSIDHIIPLALGGTHEPRNVQAAHFLCNSRKGTGGTDQLRLVG